jgi:hypothetical protein
LFVLNNLPVVQNGEAKMAFVWRQGAQQVPRLLQISCQKP